MTFCEKCGAKMSRGAKFCAGCGIEVIQGSKNKSSEKNSEEKEKTPTDEQCIQRVCEPQNPKFGGRKWTKRNQRAPKANPNGYKRCATSCQKQHQINHKMRTMNGTQTEQQLHCENQEKQLPPEPGEHDSTTPIISHTGSESSQTNKLRQELRESATRRKKARKKHDKFDNANPTSDRRAARVRRRGH